VVRKLGEFGLNFHAIYDDAKRHLKELYLDNRERWKHLSVSLSTTLEIKIVDHLKSIYHTFNTSRAEIRKNS
jgi:hypothetical protein